MKYARWIGVALLAVAIPITADAQVDTGKISGYVRDSTNAMVAGAMVTLTNERTGEARALTTNGEGYFSATTLKPSTYSITAAKSGFSTIEYTQMPLAVGQELTLDFEFKPAGVEEAVTVVGTLQIVDTSSARIGANVTEREVQALPVNGRQVSQLMLQAPGSQNSGTGTWSDITFSGRAVNQNAIRFDGIEAGSVIDASPGQSNGEIATPFKLQSSLENVQEFRVESSGYPAEYGTGSGGQVSVITKSGSNDFHGSGFEYLRNDALDKPNFFDTTSAGLKKSELSQHQFGGSFGGPLARGRAFFFASVEGYRLDAGLNVIEGVPSDAAWARAVPAILALRPGFVGPGAVLLPGASKNADIDIYQLQGSQKVTENAFSIRTDFRANDRWSAYVRVSHDRGTSDSPETVAGRVLHVEDNPTNAVFNLQGILSDRTINEFKVGYNAAPTQVNGVLANPIINGIDFSRLVINTSGNVANSGIAGQGGSTGLAIPGGLVRANSSTNGRGQPYDPYSLSFVDSLSSTRGGHFLKFGGEVRLIRMTTDRLGGVTYSFSNLNNFLANTSSTIDFNLDVSAPSPYNNGVTGQRRAKQEYYIGYAQDEWRLRSDVTLNYGLRYEYYAPLREANNHDVIFDIDTGTLKAPSAAFYKSNKDNFLPRVSLTYAPGRTVLRSGFGILVGPGQTEDRIQLIESDRIWATPSGAAGSSFPADIAAVTARFSPSDPNYLNRAARVRAYANEYTIPERVYQYTVSVQQQLPGSFGATAAYIGSQGRNLFLRSVANKITNVITNPDPTKAAFTIREFSVVQRDAAGTVTGVLQPWAEIDYKTSGGRDEYNALQLALTRRSARGVSTNLQYTLGKSTGNTGGSNEADTAANNARTLEEFKYDDGYNKRDVRHTFNLSVIYPIPYGRGRALGSEASGVAQALLGGWEVGGIVNARSGTPVNVLITRPDILYFDGTNYFGNPAAGRTVVINTPGGGNSRNVRRPDLVPGVPVFVKDGSTQFLNPAAFAIPLPGQFGNLKRNSIHGPSVKQLDLMFSKKFATARASNVEFRVEIFNVLNTDNFATPVGSLPNVIPGNVTTEANTLQPGKAYTSGPAGTFGKLTSTVGRTVGLGTNRQVQLALRFTF